MSCSHVTGTAGFHAVSSLTAASFPAFESLFHAKALGERVVCVSYPSEFKARSGFFHTLVRVDTALSQEAHGKNPLKRGIKVKKEKWVFECCSTIPKKYTYIHACIPGEGNGSPLQHSWLDNPMDTGAWWVTVEGIARVGHLVLSLCYLLITCMHASIV